MIPVPLNLKPCPFCGGKAKLISVQEPQVGARRCFVTCAVCGVEMPRIARSYEEAAKVWNRRATVAAEIFAEIYSYLTPFPNRCALISLDALAELKKKYTEEQPCNQTTKQE